MPDGNAAQVRAIIDQAVDATIERKGLFSADLARLEEHIDARIAAAISASESKLKLWVIGGVATQLLAVLPIIFFLGGIYNTNATALEMLKKQQTQMEERGRWMSERERWEQSVEQWAEPKGFAPPRQRMTPP